MLDQVVKEVDQRPSSRWLIVVEGKEVWLSNSHIPPFIPPFGYRSPGLIVSFVIMECRTPSTLRKELRISPAILLFSASFFDMLQALCCLTYLLQGDTEWTSRHLAHWTRQALVPNVSEHVILPFGTNGHRGPYQSHSSVTAIRLGPQKVKSNKGFNRNKGKK